MDETALKIDPPRGVCHMCLKNPVLLKVNNIPERKYIQLRKYQKYQFTPENICGCCYDIVKNYYNLLKSTSYKIRKYRKLKKQAKKRQRHGNVSITTAGDQGKISGETNHSERSNVCKTTGSISKHFKPNNICNGVEMKQKKKNMTHTAQKHSAPSNTNVLPQSIVNGLSTNSMSESHTAQIVNSSLGVTSNIDDDHKLCSLSAQKHSAPSNTNVLPQSIVNGLSTNSMSESHTAQIVNSSLGETSNIDDDDDKLCSSGKLKRCANSNSKIIPLSSKHSKMPNCSRYKVTKISDHVINTNKKQVLQNSESSNCLNATEMRNSHIDNIADDPTKKEDCGVQDCIRAVDINVAHENSNKDTSSVSVQEYVEQNNSMFKQSESMSSIGNSNEKSLLKRKKKPGPKSKSKSNTINLHKSITNVPSKSNPVNETTQGYLSKTDIEISMLSGQKKSGGGHTPNPKDSNDIDRNNQKINRNNLNKHNHVKKSNNNTAKHNQTYSQNTYNDIQSTETSREATYKVRKVKGCLKTEKATQINPVIKKPIGFTHSENHEGKGTETNSTLTSKTAAPTLPNPRVISKSPSKTVSLALSNNAVASVSKPKKAHIVTANCSSAHLSNGLEVNTMSNSENNKSSNEHTNSDCAGRNLHVVTETKNLIPLHNVKIGPKIHKGRQVQEQLNQAVQEQMEEISCNMNKELPHDDNRTEVGPFITSETLGPEISDEDILHNGMQLCDISAVAFKIEPEVEVNSDHTNNSLTRSHESNIVSVVSPSAVEQPCESLPEMVIESRYVNEFVYPEVTNRPVTLFCRKCHFIFVTGLDYRIHKDMCPERRISHRFK